jgi:hypothetical protein
MNLKIRIFRASWLKFLFAAADRRSDVSFVVFPRKKITAKNTKGREIGISFPFCAFRGYNIFFLSVWSVWSAVKLRIPAEEEGGKNY